MKTLLFILLATASLLSSCACKCEGKYKIVDANGYEYYTDSYNKTQTNCITFTGKSGFTKERQISLCGAYTIIDNEDLP